jgi:hypothetical protein
MVTRKVGLRNNLYLCKLVKALNLPKDKLTQFIRKSDSEKQTCKAVSKPPGQSEPFDKVSISS